MIRKMKETKAITLVALVITIIVLLILAGVTIAMLSGENGLLGKSKQAKEITNYEQAKEEINLAVSAAYAGSEGEKGEKFKAELVMQLTDNLKVTELDKETDTVKGKHKGCSFAVDTITGMVKVDNNQIEEAIKPGQLVTGKNKKYTDSKGRVAIIPKGFAIVPGLDDISEGLVISDVVNDTANVGNQFVWIPVAKNTFDTEFIRRAGYYKRKSRRFINLYRNRWNRN